MPVEIHSEWVAMYGLDVIAMNNQRSGNPFMSPDHIKLKSMWPEDIVVQQYADYV